MRDYVTNMYLIAELVCLMWLKSNDYRYNNCIQDDVVGLSLEMLYVTTRNIRSNQAVKHFTNMSYLSRVACVYEIRNKQPDAVAIISNSNKLQHQPSRKKTHQTHINVFQIQEVKYDPVPLPYDWRAQRPLDSAGKDGTEAHRYRGDANPLILRQVQLHNLCWDESVT